jgi:hypothetical protein
MLAQWVAHHAPRFFLRTLSCGYRSPLEPWFDKTWWPGEIELLPWMPLKYNPNGSLDIYIQASSPGAAKEGNWLPAPASRPFNLTARDYQPTETVLEAI